MQDIAVTFRDAPIKCLSLWFESGDVIVVAGYVGFRAHKDVLSDNSRVLADMLSGLAVDDKRDQEELDGCPVVRLEDSVHDVKYLLRMLYNGINQDISDGDDDDDDGDISPLRQADCSDLVSNARMSHKYRLHTRTEAYRLLRHRFPPTFAEWEARGSLPAAAAAAPEAINAFRAIGDDDLTTSHMIVALYLACGLLPYGALLRGLRRCDGVLEALRKDDVERCVLLREALLERSAYMAARLFEGEASADCRCRGAGRRCDDRISETRTAILYGDDDVDGWVRADPLGEFVRSRIDGMELEREICGICAGMLCERDRELRRELWEEMPVLLARVEEEMRRARRGLDEDEK